MHQPRLQVLHPGLLQGPRCAPQPRAWPRRAPRLARGCAPPRPSPGASRREGRAGPVPGSLGGAAPRAEKAGPQPRAARPSPDRGNNRSHGLRLRRCATRRPGAPRPDGAPSQTFLAPFPVAGQSPGQRWRREVSVPGAHEGYEEPRRPGGARDLQRRPAFLLVRGGAAVFPAVRGFSCFLLPWATSAPRGAENQQILPTGEQTACSERPSAESACGFFH